MIKFLNANLLTMCFLCLNLNTRAQPVYDFKDIDKIIMDSMDRHQFTSMSIGIIKGNKVAYTRGYGYANLKSKIPATDETVYQIGSLTKTFTGNLLAHLIVKGKMKLNDSLSLYFPMNVRFPKDSTGKTLTIKDLATHSSGLSRYPENLNRIDCDPILGYPKSKMYDAINSSKLEFNIGRRYSYSNFAYGILGTAMENGTKKTYNQLLEEYIFSPLNMSSSSAALDDKVKSKLAIAYFDDNPTVETKPWKMESLTAHGGIFSNVKDLCKFILYFRDTTQASVKLQRTAHFKISKRTDYGLGCFMTTYTEPSFDRVIYHGGDLDSYSSNFVFYPDKDFGYIILSSGAGGQALGRLFNAIETELKKKLGSVEKSSPIVKASYDSISIQRAMRDYLEGFYEGDSSKIIRAVSPHVTKYGFWKEKNASDYIGEAMSYKEMVEYAVSESKKATKAKMSSREKVEIYDIQDQTASGKVTAWWGTDYILLEKVKGKWMIRIVLWQGPLKT